MRRRWTRVMALMRKETIQIVRDWRTLLLILAFPLLELFLFAYAVDLTVDHLPTAVADLSLDASSRAFTEALVVSGFFDINESLASEQAVIRAIDEGRAKAGIVIPPGFASDLARGEAQALIILDGADSFTVKSGYAAASAIAEAHALELVAQEMTRVSGRAGTLAPPVETATRVLYNPNMDDMIFILPGVIGMLLQLLCAAEAAVTVVRERELGTIEQLLATPIRPIELIVGKMVPKLFLAVLDLAIIVGAGVYWFGVPFQGDIWLFAWLSLIFIVSSLALGLLISTRTQTQRQALQITVVVLMLSMLLTGLIYPRAPMPPVVRAIGNLLPVTYFIRIARGIITRGVGLAFMRSDVYVLLGYSVVVTALSAVAFQKRLD